MSEAERGPITTVRVEIAGGRYTIRTDADEAYTRRCASLVDERMRRIGGPAGMDQRKTAIMAALALSDELLQAREKFRRQAQTLAERIEEELGDGRSERTGDRSR